MLLKRLHRDASRSPIAIHTDGTPDMSLENYCKLAVNLPTKAEHQSAKPTARGPVSVKLGLPIATAYTTATKRKVMTNSQPKAMPCSMESTH
jgi:hypothetical protein